MAAFLDICCFNPTTGSTTDWTYSSAVTGYQSPADAGAVNGAKYKYRAESNDLSQWEVGEGAWDSLTGVLARTTVLFNSSGGTSKINFSTVPRVAVVALKEDLLSIEEANSFTTTQQQQARTNIGWPDGQLPGTVGTTQPGAGKVGERISNSGTSALTSGTPANVTSITLTAGVWDLEAYNEFSGPGATTSLDWNTIISATTASVTPVAAQSKIINVNPVAPT